MMGLRGADMFFETGRLPDESHFTLFCPMACSIMWAIRMMTSL